MTAKEQKELIILQEDVKHIKGDVNEIKESSKELNDTMTRISSKLFKDDLTGEEGYFEVTKRNGVRLTKLENIRAIGAGVIMVLGMVAGWFLKVKSH